MTRRSITPSREAVADAVRVVIAVSALLALIAGLAYVVSVGGQ